MVKCLAQEHKHHDHSHVRGSNPHSDDSAIRTQIQCTIKPARLWHSNATMLSAMQMVLCTWVILFTKRALRRRVFSPYTSSPVVQIACGFNALHGQCAWYHITLSKVCSKRYYLCKIDKNQIHNGYYTASPKKDLVSGHRLASKSGAAFFFRAMKQKLKLSVLGGY